MFPIPTPHPPIFQWQWGLFFLSSAIALRVIRRRWPAYQEWLDVLFIFLWTFLVLVRLDIFIRSDIFEGNRHGLWMWMFCFIAAGPVVFLQAVGRRLWGMAAVLFASAVVFVDILSYHLFSSLWRFEFWPAIKTAFTNWKSIEDVFVRQSPREMAWLVTECIVVVFVAPLPGRRAVQPIDPPVLRWAKIVLLSLACLLGIRLSWGFRQIYDNGWYSSEKAFMDDWGVWNHHLFFVVRDLSDQLQKWLHRMDVDESVVKVQRHVSGLSREHQHFGVANGYNLVLVQAQTLHHFVLGSRIMGQEVTPFLNSLRKSSLEFTRFYSQVRADVTPDAQFITFTSLNPLVRGSIALLKRRDQFVALPEVLRQHHYYTFSAQPQDEWVVNQSYILRRYGFMESRFRMDLGQIRQEDVEFWGMADEVFMERAAPLLRFLPRPFFAFLTPVMAQHPFPNPIPKHLRYLSLGAMEKSPLGQYMQEMRQFDRAVEILFKEIQSSDLRDNTIVAIYGDRPSRLPVDSILQSFLDIHDWRKVSPLYMAKVPLIIWIPKSSLSGEIKTAGGHVDIAPSLLALLGIERPSSFLGRSLLDSPAPVLAFQDGSVIGDTFEFRPPLPNVDDSGCFDVHGGSTVTVTQCDGIRGLARPQLEISDLIHAGDLSTLLKNDIRRKNIK